MDSYLSSNESTFPISQSKNYFSGNIRHSANALIVEKTLADTDTVNIDFKDKFKTLNLTAQEIVKKLNELLQSTLPEGIESLNPDQYTSEATSTRIVQGVTAFFGVFKGQHPDLSEEEALDKFMDTVKSGVQKGYDDAFGTLKGLGAFDIDGIQKGVEQTKILIDQKLDSFYQAKRKELGLESTESATKENVNNEVKKQAGVHSLDMSA